MHRSQITGAWLKPGAGPADGASRRAPCASLPALFPTSRVIYQALTGSKRRLGHSIESGLELPQPACDLCARSVAGRLCRSERFPTSITYAAPVDVT